MFTDRKFVVCIVDEHSKEKFFGPFYTAEEALKWGEENYGYTHTPYTMIVKVLYYPMKQD